MTGITTNQGPVVASAGQARPESPSGVTKGRLPHFPALDGIRGIGLVVILLAHAEIGWAEGGFIALTAFFTLSGFLITSLLLVERERTGAIRLSTFWVRRARRLVPGIVVAFGLIAALLPFLERPPRGLIGDALASSFWVANWRFVFEDRTYADIFSSPSPFQHFWSLAVEEQFYLLFPLLVVGIIGRRTAIPRARLAIVIGVLALASLATSFLVASPASPYRAYYGTDVRAVEILLGALLAVALCRRVGSGGSGLARPVSQALGIVGLGALVAAFFALDEFDPRIFEGGFFVVAAASALVITSAIDRGTVAERLLSLRPLVFLGTVSYGAYLFHWPIYLVLTEHSTGLATVPLLVVRVAISLGLAVVSHRFIEDPIRRNGLPARVGPPAWLNGAVAGIALVALASGEIKPVAGSGVDTAAGTVLSTGGAEQPTPTAPTDTTSTTVAPSTSGAPPVGSGTAPKNTAPKKTTVERPRSSPAAAAPAATTTTAKPAEDAPLPAEFYRDPGEVEVPPPPADAAEKTRILVIGDSVGNNLGTGFGIWASERSDVATLNLAVPACPMSRGGERRFTEGEPFPVDPACSWWADDRSDRYRAAIDFKPHVIVLQDGLNEFLDRLVPEWDDWHKPGDATFDRWLLDEYEALFERLAAPSNAKVITTNAPCGDWARHRSFRQMDSPNQRVDDMNALYDAFSDRQSLSGVRIADLFERVCPLGLFSNRVEGVNDARPDGLHFSDEAAAALVRNWLGPMALEEAAATARP